MAVSIKHKFVSNKADSQDATLVRPSNWNDEHNLIMNGSSLLGRTATGTGAAAEVTLGAGLEFSAGALRVKIGSGGLQPYFGDYTPVNRAGDTMTGSLVLQGGELQIRRDASTRVLRFANTAGEEQGIIYSDATGDNLIMRIKTSEKFRLTLGGTETTGRHTIKGSNRTWYFEHYTTGGYFRLVDVEGNAERWRVGTDGSVWTSQLGDLSTRIESRAAAWANDRVSQIASRLVSRAQGIVSGSSGTEGPSGTVVTGFSHANITSDVQIGYYYRYLQIYDPVRGWVSATYQ